jgi:uncharacterized protein (DUF1778 family)
VKDKRRSIETALKVMSEEAFGYMVVALQEKAKYVVGNGGFTPQSHADAQRLLDALDVYFKDQT